MQWWSRFWEYLTMPQPEPLSGLGWTLVSISLFVAVGGLLLVVAPALITPPAWRRTGSRRLGPYEKALRAEWRVKVGAGITSLACGFLASLLLHLLGTPGLRMRLLPALVIASALISTGIALVYYVVWFPRLLRESQRLDKREAMNTAKGKPKTRMVATEVKRQAGAFAMPTKAIIAALTAIFVFYLPYAGVSVQDGHDHIMHMLGAFFVAPFAGYLIGLALSLGQGLPDGFLLLKLQRKPSKPRASA